MTEMVLYQTNTSASDIGSTTIFILILNIVVFYFNSHFN